MKLNRLLVGTGNPGKLSEFREILEPAGIVVMSPTEAVTRAM